MPIPCEIVETLVVATSECPATDVIAVQADVGSGSSQNLPGITQPTVIEVLSTSSQVVIDAYALMINEGTAASTVSPTAVVTELALERARAADRTISFINQLAVSTALVEDEIASLDVPQLLVSAAQAASFVTPGTTAVFTVSERVQARSFASLGLLEAITENASAASSVTLIRRAEQLVTEMADGSSEAYPSAMPGMFLLISHAGAASLTLLQQDVVVSLTATVEASSEVWYRDPDRLAWVLNTETTAASWYDNFDFESITQTPGKVLGVGPDGLYELTGANDAGVGVQANLATGFSDYGSPQTKRLDNVYFGYTSEGVLAVQTEVKESGTPPATYFLEQRDASAPRNSRVTPGKGLYGRYWRVTIRNANGADFEVHDAAVDIAVSSRRV
jgi:hypothetical protein